MRFLVLAEPKYQAPPERIPGMIDGALEWNRRHEEHLEQFGLFPGGGGFAVVNVPDEATLHRMVVGHPFAFFSEIKTIPFVDGETGWRQLHEVMRTLTP